MHVALVSTYPPRACGLATFTRDLRSGLLAAGHTAEVVSIIHEPTQRSRPEVAIEVRQPERDDYAAAAEAINASAAEVVSVQHEFGIFGGSEGRHVFDLMERVRQPVVTTLHTVLPDPPEHYRSALLGVVDRSARLVVMTETAREILTSTYGVRPEAVAVVPHGAPALPPAPRDEAKARRGLAGRTVLLTFGLLGPSKGVEFALRSLAPAVEAAPDLLYVVLGATHPDIVRREGEAHRDHLRTVVSDLGLRGHVRFEDRYVDPDDLWDWLSAADVYVTPYPGMDQICSGTLANALAAGLPVVSTPYLHAREVLADGAGALIPYGDTEAFGSALARFTADAEARAEAGERARAFGATTAWPRTGAAYAEVFAAAVQASTADRLGEVHPGALPAALGYLVQLTDDVGPIQHAAFGIADRRHGYCTDDAGRALVAAYAAARQLDPKSGLRADLLRVARTCLSFVHHAQRPDGTFHNFMDYGRRFVDDGGTQDTVGRALWGLGATMAWAPDEPARQLARQLLDRSLGVDLTHPRALAYSACGLDLALSRDPGHRAVRDRLDAVARRLVDLFHHAASPRWRWFCDAMTYANALVPYALLRAADRLGDGPDAALYAEVGEDAMDFVRAHTVRGGQFDAVGNRGWLRRDGDRALFDQQPIDAGYSAWIWADLESHAEGARLAVEWFLGRNRLRQPLFDPQTGACFDGLTLDGVNRNQGAESAIACALALLAADRLGMTADTPSVPPQRAEAA